MCRVTDAVPVAAVHLPICNEFPDGAIIITAAAPPSAISAPCHAVLNYPEVGTAHNSGDLLSPCDHSRSLLASQVLANFHGKYTYNVANLSTSNPETTRRDRSPRGAFQGQGIRHTPLGPSPRSMRTYRGKTPLNFASSIHRVSVLLVRTLGRRFHSIISKEGIFPCSTAFEDRATDFDSNSRNGVTDFLFSLFCVAHSSISARVPLVNELGYMGLLVLVRLIVPPVSLIAGILDGGRLVIGVAFLVWDRMEVVTVPLSTVPMGELS
ncbi:hypothetical protein BU15DRAFT_63443 [Melanogaster broomeanus]|nr:hypothetical protein BU15DRAFT_63443 [Melanogaster broomeanus]